MRRKKGRDTAEAGLSVTQPRRSEASAHRAAILRRFDEASAARDLAVELSIRAEQLMLDAINEHDEARKALRRVAEGAI